MAQCQEAPVLKKLGGKAESQAMDTKLSVGSTEKCVFFGVSLMLLCCIQASVW